MKKRGLGMVFQRGATWWVQYYFRGKRHRESAGSTVRADAVKLLRRRMAEMGAGQLRGPDMDKTSFEDLARMVEQDYVVNARRSMRRLKASLSALRPVFGGALARDITLDRLNAYVADRLQVKKAPATVKNELIALHRAFRLAERSGKAICPPFPVLSLHNVRSGFFEREDFLAVHGRLSEPVQAVATFAYLTGWRTPSEILPLQWRQVDFAAGTLRLDPGTTKNGEGRVFPFAVLPELADLIQRQRAYTDMVQREKGSIIPWVFHRKGTPIRRSFYREWHAACQGAKVAGRIPHDFRRTAVRNLERAGVPRSVAMKLTGHKTENVYRRYAIVSEADLSEGLKKLAVLHGQEVKGNAVSQ